MRYYKIDFGNLDINLDYEKDFEIFLNDETHLKKLIKDEIKYLVQEGIIFTEFENYLVVTDKDIKFKKLDIQIITECDKKGNVFNTQKIDKYNKYNNRRTKLIVEYLKTKNIRDCKDKGNVITFSCPICNKTNEKMYIYKDSFKIFSHSHTDCNHDKEWKAWTNDLWELWKNSYNPDFAKVKWDENFVNVKYKYDGEEVKSTLYTYNEKFNNCEDKPKLLGFDIKTVIENVIQLLKHYDITLELNEIKMNYSINREHLLEDYILKIQDYCTKHGFRITKERLLDSLSHIGKTNKYNPIKEYLLFSHNLYKDNKEDCYNEYLKLLDTIETESENKEEFIYKFLLQMCYIALNDNKTQHSSQFLLVLQGKQGCGKTTWFKNLIPNHLQMDYFLEGRSFDLSKKDDVMESTTTWLTECGEIASTFKKSDQEAMKNFITTSKDKFRLPYAKESIVKPRTMSLCGTTNDIEYLRDLTGSRRYLTLPTTKINAFHDLNLEMIWCYIYSKYLENDVYWFNEEQINKIISENREFTAKPENIQIIEEYFDLYPDDGEWKTSNEIYNLLPFDPKLNKFIVGKELKKCNVKLKIKHKTGYYYVKQIKKSEV